jgi:malate dehydrogenase (oxaloacetate-decarboxylating)(NADP+)
MKPIYAAQAAKRKNVAFAEGEDRRVLRAVQVVVDEGLAIPVLVGRRHIIEQRIDKLGLRCRPAATSRSSTSRTTRATATSGRPTTG